MRPRPPRFPSPRPASRTGGRSVVRMGPWRAPRRFLPVALLPVAIYLVLWGLVGYSLGTAGCRASRPTLPLVGTRAGAGGGVEVLVESSTFAMPAPGAAVAAGPGNRFDAGWEMRTLDGRPALIPISGTARLRAVNLGEEVARTLTLDLAREGLPEGERLRVRTGERELAQTTLRAAGLPLRVRLPEDLPVGAVLLDLVFGSPVAGADPGASTPPAATGTDSAGTPPGGALARAASASAAGAASGTGAARPAVPAVYGASLDPALPPGTARVEGGDLVMGGNGLVYLHCQLGGSEALVGTFVPPGDARPGQRFDLSVELPDGTPIRRFGWRPSFWNRLRGARSFELPLRGNRGPVRVRLIARAGAAGGPPGRWQGLGLIDVTGQILTPGQGQ